MSNNIFSRIGTSDATFDAVDNDNKVEGTIMPMNNEYVTKQELENSLLKQELLFKNMQSQSDVNFAKIDGKFDLLDSKIDNFAKSIPLVIDAKINTFKEENRKEHKETIRFIWGTIVIGIISIAASVVSIFF